jgi:tetratricopeptide (TPR) repeat protein
MSQIVQDILHDPIWLGIVGAVVALYALFTAHTVLKTFRPESGRIRILKLALIAALVASLVLLVPFGGKVLARLFVLSESFVGAGERTVPVCSRAIGLDASYAAAYRCRGFGYDYQKQYEMAIADYTEALRLNPNDAWVYYGRGLAHNALSHYQEAIDDLTEALRLNPNDPWAYNSRGLAYYGLADYEKAIADYNEALRIDANFASPYYNLGLVHYDRGEYEQARASLETYLRVGPLEEEDLRRTARELIAMMESQQ